MSKRPHHYQISFGPGCDLAGPNEPEHYVWVATLSTDIGKEIFEPIDEAEQCEIMGFDYPPISLTLTPAQMAGTEPVNLDHLSLGLKTIIADCLNIWRETAKEDAHTF